MALRLPGLYSQIPTEKRGRLPYCAAHEADAFARRAAKYPEAGNRNDHPPPGNAVRQPKPAAGRGIRPPAHDHEQGKLDL